MLYRIERFDSCGDKPRLEDILVHAADPEKARKIAVEWLLESGLYADMAAFADPRQSDVVQVPARQKAGVVETHWHHCTDHLSPQPEAY